VATGKTRTIATNKTPKDFHVSLPPAETCPPEGRQVFESGAVRDHVELARYDLIPVHCLRRLGQIYSEGAVRYKPYNWTKGMPFSDVYNHAMEHLAKWREGDRSEDQLAKVAWGIFTLMYYEEYCPECNDFEQLKPKGK
jgi:hypothetical protein